MNISPSVYEHAAQLIGCTPWEASRGAELMFRAHSEAYRRYRHTPIMPGIDIYNLEAEAYGGRIDKPYGIGIPAIAGPVFESTAQLQDLAPLDPRRDGRVPMQIEVARRLRDTFPEADIRVPVAGPFSIASNLVGFETLLMDCALEPETAAESLMHLVEGQVAFARGVKRAGVDVAFFESAACPPMLSPAKFREVELPALKSIMSRIGEVVGHPIPCIIGGDTTPIVEALLETGTGYLVCPFETYQAAFLAKVADRPDVRIRVNCDVRIIASGTREQIREEADRVIQLMGDRPNTTLGTGALPYEAPPENVLYIMDYVSRIAR
jgi:uroporphyrinogen decarboxylase